MTTSSFVMPEIFYQASMLLNTVDPGLKIAGVTNKRQYIHSGTG